MALKMEQIRRYFGMKKEDRFKYFQIIVEPLKLLFDKDSMIVEYNSKRSGLDFELNLEVSVHHEDTEDEWTINTLMWRAGSGEPWQRIPDCIDNGRYNQVYEAIESCLVNDLNDWIISTIQEQENE